MSDTCAPVSPRPQLLVEGQVTTGTTELLQACVAGMNPVVLKREGQRLAARRVLEAAVKRMTVRAGGLWHHGVGAGSCPSFSFGVCDRTLLSRAHLHCGHCSLALPACRRR